MSIRTGHIGYIAPFAVFFQYAGASAHYVAVNVDGVDRVGYSHTVVMAEYVAYVSRIALGSVVDEDFLWAEMNAACRVIVFDNGINQKVITRVTSPIPRRMTSFLGCVILKVLIFLAMSENK